MPDTPNDKLTTISGWAMALVRALETQRIDPSPLLEEAGISESLLVDGAQRIPVVNMTNLWRLATAASNDEAFGLRVANCVSPATFHTLGYSILASDNVEEIFSRAQKNVRLISEIGSLELEPRKDCYGLTVNLTQETPVVPYECIDAFMGSVIAFSRNYLQMTPKLMRVEMKRPLPSNPHKWEEFFGAQVIFNQRSNTLVVANIPQAKLPTANPIMAEASDQLTENYLRELDAKSVSEKVTAQIKVNILDGNNSLEKVASQMCLSERQLQRHLKEEDASYQSLLDQVRQELAVRWIKTKAYTHIEIAELLGFNTQSSFSRAFKAWTGKPPSGYN